MMMLGSKFAEKTDLAVNDLEHLSSLDLDADVLPRKTAIIATIGPSTSQVETLCDIILSGVTIARLNLSHGNPKEHIEYIRCLRRAEEILDLPWPIAIALDTRGPRIRTGFLKYELRPEIMLVKGDHVCLTTEKEFQHCSDLDNLYISYASLCDAVSIGDHIFIDDGYLDLKVDKVEKPRVLCSVEVGGALGSRKGVNIPNTNIDLPVLSQSDINILNLAIRNCIDLLFVSFMKKAEDISKIRDFLGVRAKTIKIIVKIENGEGIRQIDEILKVADGILIGRSDLGLEIPLHKICTVQKMIIAKCNMAGKPVICATQMLESMKRNRYPTTTEVIDVANAIIDGCDAIMLSGETAVGKHPLDCVRFLDSIAKQAECCILYKQRFENNKILTPAPLPATTAIAIAAVEASFELNAPVIIVFASTAESAIQICRLGPRANVLAITRSAITAKYLNFFQACHPILINSNATDECLIPFSTESLYRTRSLCEDLKSDAWQTGIDSKVKKALLAALQYNFISKGEVAIIVTGWQAESNITNTIRIIRCP